MDHHQAPDDDTQDDIRPGAHSGTEEARLRQFASSSSGDGEGIKAFL